MKPATDGSTCPVADRFRLPYLAFHEDAERRAVKGQEQVLCATCERWRWPDHVRACPQFKLSNGNRT